jgi:hypothetical protein
MGLSSQQLLAQVHNPLSSGVPAVMTSTLNNATDIEAEICYVEGLVAIQKASSGNWEPVVWIEGVSHIKLNVGDSIKTSLKSKAELKFTNGNTVRLAEQSVLLVKEAREDKANKKQNTVLKLLDGKIWNKVIKELVNKDLNKDKQLMIAYQVETPVAVAAVKGTAFEISFGANASEVRVFEGLVQASNPLGVMQVPANSFSFITNTLPPSPPLPMPPGSDQEWNWQREQRRDEGQQQPQPSGLSIPVLPVAAAIVPMIVPFEQKEPTPEVKEALIKETQDDMAKDHKSPFLAGIMSLLVPGWGEFYAEQGWRGLLIGLVETGCLAVALDGKDKSEKYYQQAQYYNNNYDNANYNTYYNKAKDAYNQNQTFIKAAALVAVLGAWDSFKEAEIHNERLEKDAKSKGKMSWEIGPDATFRASYSKDF